MKPRICVLRADGTNCDAETAYAFDKAGGQAELVHVNELRTKARNLRDYQILAIPGGFSYGDDIASGKILAVELISYLRSEIEEFVGRSDTLVIGICNGFQVLVRTGLLPFRNMGNMQATLTANDSGRFECRWVSLLPELASNCVFTKNIEGPIELQIAHGEGKFFTDDVTLGQIEANHLVALRYAEDYKIAQSYPANPNGSLNNIAGICDQTGRIFGLMPHPERFVELTQHPNWRRSTTAQPQGLQIFQNAISFTEGA
jgi:phosphoribosylformylglycinamidine synthase